MYPEDLKYTEEHEWAKLADAASAEAAGGGDQSVRIGITSFAQEALGDIVFVTMPSAGETVEAGQSVGEVESTKSVSELYAPVSGTVVATNAALEGQPELINSDPYGEGWILEISVADRSQLDRLLDAAAYERHTTSE
ncbi:MAG: glycine cleavage system protein GcvH [Frankiaceae bacterium]